ncbi:DUF6922 domain-containing protein [Gelidibacter salicanalis]|uniref:DUF6922 domain-containing protein n=1 Tax=Gelidibacter salicanalis TaxID=291193 RepID=A0A934NKJ8_9FLAO|nr:hypothetical protein [Gelidibacter salicanalis]MBJ7880967.1 hypothetical protein [Gelidibacter salicanalis]
MRNKIDISKVFPKYVFWDMDSSKLSLKRDKVIIIPRALYATTKDSFLKDIKLLEEYYSKNEIVEILKDTKENISNEVCELVSNRYGTKPFYRYAL